MYHILAFISYITRRQPFSDIIAKNDKDAFALFAIVDRLTNPPVSVTTEVIQ